MSADDLKQKFMKPYLSYGKDKFYRFILFSQLNKLVLITNGTYKGASPDLECLDNYDQFLILFRREGDISYLDVAKLFRKAAHKIHRIMLKQKMIIDNNNKFLKLV